ncbi:hypothetical protein [Mesorhizobium sp. ISC11]|uniref:hypothetical protein n=1 Tax=Mesorhizobium sp. ISC11 TaxID=3076428 RepID=UPI00301DAD8B
MQSHPATSSDTDSQASFRQLVGLAGGSVTSDLLNVLNTIKGLSPNQNKTSGATSDLTSDKGKQGAGYTNTDDTLKKAMKDILKPND